MSFTFAGANLLNFKEAGPDYRWVDIKRFEWDTPSSDADLLAALIDNPWYGDDYASGPGNQEPPWQQGVHGPYRLDCIGPETFSNVTPEEYVERLSSWFLQNGSLPDPFFQRLISEVIGLTESASSIYELPNLGSDALGKFAAIVGIQGFNEFILINRTSKVLSLVVGSDD